MLNQKEQIPKLKIVFFGCHSTTVLKDYWEYLKDKADCCWLVLYPSVYKDIKEMGCEKVFFKDTLCRRFRPRYLWELARRISALFIGKEARQRRLYKMLDELDPDIVLTNAVKPLSNYQPRHPKVMKVQVFHSVPYERCFITPHNLKYDFVALPSEYHKQRICQRFNIKDSKRLHVVGWPRGDNFLNNKFTGKDRDIFMKRIGLNPEFKNVLYAPTHSSFYEKGLFPKSFGAMTMAFEEFCRRVKEMNVNLIIKLHPNAIKLISDSRLHKIAEGYNVSLAYKKSTGHLDTTVESYLWISDVLISDVSGIITDFMILNRPIVYIEPDGPHFNWENTDLLKEFRAGHIVESMKELIGAVKKSLENPDEYKQQREDVARKIFYKPDGRSSERASEAVLSHYKEFSK